jgi:rubredoxin
MDVVDCWLDPDNDVPCETCPFFGELPKNISCREATRQAVHKRIKETSKE